KASDVIQSELVLTDDGTDVDEKDSVLGYRDSIASGIDLRSMRASHGKKTVSVTLRFAELHRDAHAVIAFRVNGKAEPDRLFMSSNSRSGRIISDSDINKKICKVPVKTKTGAKGTMRVVIDRSCLADPTRFKVALVSMTAKVTDTSITTRIDVISPKNVRVPRWTKWLRSS
ncbi:hypothetical protein, partial [Aeromicrobium endophyticum]